MTKREKQLEQALKDIMAITNWSKGEVIAIARKALRNV